MVKSHRGETRQLGLVFTHISLSNLAPKRMGKTLSFSQDIEVISKQILETYWIVPPPFVFSGSQQLQQLLNFIGDQ